MSTIRFDDGDIFGDQSFLDILEDNDVPFIYDGEFLTFETNVSEVYARQLWSGLTGSYQIGDYR